MRYYMIMVTDANVSPICLNYTYLGTDFEAASKLAEERRGLLIQTGDEGITDSFNYTEKLW